MGKPVFRIICPICEGEEVHIYNSIYDEIVIKCDTCGFREGEV
jgi:C4-type Zn-finger protein